VLIALESHTILMPAIWRLEASNAILVGELRKRLNWAEIKTFVTLLKSLFVVQDAAPATEHITNVLPLARTHGLAAWDASYLELSICRNAPLATLDEKLQRAAKHAGVMLSRERLESETDGIPSSGIQIYSGFRPDPLMES
jgi:predicted nucleic acid-binding protein